MKSDIARRKNESHTSRFALIFFLIHLPSVVPKERNRGRERQECVFAKTFRVNLRRPAGGNLAGEVHFAISAGKWRHVCLCCIYSEQRATLRRTGGCGGKLCKRYRALRGIYGAYIYTRTHARPRARTYNSRRSADSCGIMQFAHETYGNTRFPCAGTKLQTRVFHPSSFLR